MNRQSQWLFEAPFISELTEQINYELMADREAPTTVLRSLRFRSDSRFQAAANNRPPMRQGERGRGVQMLQKALIDLGFPMPISTQRRVSPDGIYGSETTATVRKFQQKYGLKVDGVVGRNTMSRLDQLFVSAPPINQEPMCGVPQGKFQALRRQRSINPEQESAGSIIPQPILCLFQNTSETKHFFNGAENWAKKIQAIANPTPTKCKRKVGSTPYNTGADIIKAIKNANLCLGQKLKEIHIFSHSSTEGVGGAVKNCSGLYRRGLKKSNGDLCVSLGSGGKLVSDIPTNVLDENVIFFLHGCRTAEGCGNDINNFARDLFKHLAAKLDNPRVYGHRFRTCAGQECNWCEYSKQQPQGQKVLRIPDNLPEIPVPYRVDGKTGNPCKGTKCS
jgi:peptidoglycan hydrolase-like protein with peptidoglycan-binding domain